MMPDTATQLLAPHIQALEDQVIRRGAIVSTVNLRDNTVITTITTYNGDIASSSETSNGLPVNLDNAFEALLRVHTPND